MSVHYKFKSALDFDTITFDGLHINVADLKKAIIHQKRLGKNVDFDLQITNAQTKEGMLGPDPFYLRFEITNLRFRIQWRLGVDSQKYVINYRENPAGTERC